MQPLLLTVPANLWYYIFMKVMEAIMESAITVKGQATIPKAIREHLRLKPGDRVKFFVHPDGSVVLLPTLPASTLRGIVKPRQRPARSDGVGALCWLWIAPPSGRAPPIREGIIKRPAAGARVLRAILKVPCGST